MNRTICVLLTALLALSLAACGNGKTESQKQTASAYLDQDGATVEVTVDLSGGWSVEFVRGAAYLYDGEIIEGKDGVAMLLTLDKDVYEEYHAKAMADGNHKEADGGVYYTDETGWAAYLTALDDSAYIIITTTSKKDVEAIVARVALALD